MKRRTQGRRLLVLVPLLLLATCTSVQGEDDGQPDKLSPAPAPGSSGGPPPGSAGSGSSPGSSTPR